MDMQMQKAKEQMKALPFKEKVKNFFFYYKWHVVAALFLTFMIVITLVECVRRVQDDIIISYFSESYISAEQTEKMRDFLGYDFCIDDINGDGEKNVLLSTYSGTDQNVIMKYTAEMAAGETMVYLFDKYYYDITVQSHPDSIDFAYDITRNRELKELFGLGDEPLYFVVKSIYNTEKGDELREAMHKNAFKLYSIIVGDDMSAVYFSKQAIDDELVEKMRERFGEYAKNINDVEQKIVGISLVNEPDTGRLSEYTETISGGSASAFITDAAFYGAFSAMFPGAIEDSEDISSSFNLPSGSLYYILRKPSGSETNPEKAKLLHDNAARVLDGLRAD